MDSNAQAFPLPQDPTYTDFISAGYSDVWSEIFPKRAGLTCCQAESDNNPVSQLYQRIDLVLTQGKVAPWGVELIGTNLRSRLPDGLWPSDHAAVVAGVTCRKRVGRLRSGVASRSCLGFLPRVIRPHLAPRFANFRRRIPTMKFRACCITVSLLSVLACATLAQTASPNSSLASTQVPRLIRFSGVAMDETHNPMTGVLGFTFSLYEDQQGGSPLWEETQNIQADANGHYTALLGSVSAEGMPLELFSSGEAQWLGVQIQGQPERARVLLVSVPYALKAHEAETLSGRSISDFVLLNKTASTSSKATEAPLGSNGTSASSSPRIDNDGPTNFAGSNTTHVVSVTQNGSGLGLSAKSHALAAVAGTITGKSNTAVYGLASNTSKGSNAAGVTGQSNTETGPGVAGYANGIDGTGVLGVANATTGGTGVSGISNATSGNTNGVYGQSASPTGNGVVGNATATISYASGVYGQSASTSGSGVSGNSTATSGYTSGVYGQSASVNGTGVYGSSANWVGVGGQGATLGVWGDSATINGTGVAGYADATAGNTNGVYGQSASTSGIGVSGSATATTGDAYGIYGQTATTGFGAGVIGVTTATTGNAFGVFGQSSGTSGNGVFGIASAPSGSTIGVAGFVESPAGTAGYFVARSGSGLILQGISGNPGTQVFSSRRQRKPGYQRQSDGGREQVGEGEATRRARSRALRGREPGELVRRFRHGAVASVARRKFRLSRDFSRRLTPQPATTSF